MIPGSRDDIDVLAGEYVLGLLEPAARQEVEAALAGNAMLRDAVAFWEAKLHPLASLASPAEPPADGWDAIVVRLDSDARQGAAPRIWNRPELWRWTAAGFAAIAAALALYIALMPIPPAARYVAVLHAPQQGQAEWLATTDKDGLTIRAVAAQQPPADHAFELWAIVPGMARPQPLGVIPADGILRIATVPADVRSGTTLAISVEPPGGSPTGLPTGPVVFVGGVQPL
ncbi:MAG TPA: anti-sigma factor [Stellaceae bacterium]|nr:anti-sigma factor [Stellaceae bacterium]